MEALKGMSVYDCNATIHAAISGGICGAIGGAIMWWVRNRWRRTHGAMQKCVPPPIDDRDERAYQGVMATRKGARRVLEKAIDAWVERIEKETGVPMYFGSFES